MSNSHLPRKNPRRPFTITAQGIKRIVLGDTQEQDASVSMARQHAAVQKPERLLEAETNHFLCVVYTERGGLNDHAKQVIAAAALLASSSTAVSVLVLGANQEDCAILGADYIINVPDLGLHAYAPDRDVTAIKACIDLVKPRHIFMADCPIASGDVGRRLSAQLFPNQTAVNVVEINATQVASYQDQKHFYAKQDLPALILLAPDTTDTRLPFVGKGQLASELAEKLQTQIQGLTSTYQDEGVHKLSVTQLALEEADFIISAGNGVHEVDVFNNLAVCMEAAVGASRVAVDDGKFLRAQQIGATGKTVSASTYVAFGISGAVQHLQGIKDCRHVIAVNTDASAPIVKRANLTIIEDAQAIMHALHKQVQELRNTNRSSS